MGETEGLAGANHGAPEGPTGLAALTLRRRLGELPSFALGGEAAVVPRLPLGPSFGQTLLSALNPAFGSAFDPALLSTFRLVPLDHRDDVSVHHELVQRHQQFSCLVHRAGEQHRNDCNGNADGAKALSNVR